MSNTALFVVILCTAVFLVGAALIIAKLLAPHSTNKHKGQPYECGIPTRGASWIQFYFCDPKRSTALVMYFQNVAS